MKIWNSLSPIRRHPRLVFFLVLAVGALFLAPRSARGDVADIIFDLQDIESTLQNGIGKVLTQITKIENDINTLHQDIVWSLAAINQAKGFVNATINRYKNVMNQIHALAVNSSTLTNPRQLENAFRGASAGFANIQPAYVQVYAAVPPPTNAAPLDRNTVDMSDAAAMASLKTSDLSDQQTDQMLGLADVLEGQAASAAPGTGDMVAAQAQVANLQSQAQLSKLLAAELRLEATKLATDNSQLKRSTQHKGNLQQQMQQVGMHP